MATSENGSGGKCKWLLKPNGDFGLLYCSSFFFALTQLSHIYLFNLQTTVRGPMDPTALLISSQKVIIGISKPTFHLILHHTEPFCWIKWYLAYDAPAHTKASYTAQKYLGSNGPCHLFYVTGLKGKQKFIFISHKTQKACPWGWLETSIYKCLRY